MSADVGMSKESECQLQKFMTDSPDILKVKSDGQLEVQLDRGTLVLSANRIFDLNVNL